jgi:hypothetical protein
MAGFIVNKEWFVRNKPADKGRHVQHDGKLGMEKNGCCGLGQVTAG